MLDSLRMSLVVTRREVRDGFRDWRIIIPIALLTLIFPSLMNFTARQAVGFVQRYGANLIGDRLIPFLLMIVGFFPISISLVIALESFVGEKERRSIEPLLSSPLTDGQIYLGKLLAAMVPPLLASYLGIAVYLFGVYRQVGWTPDPVLLVQIVLLTTVQAVVMVSGAVVVSSQTTSVRAANLLASFIIIPMAFLIQGESMVMFWARYQVLWWVIAAEVLIAGLLVRTGVAHFNREELLGRELDTLDLRWSWGVFWHTFLGRSRSPLSWYRFEVLPALGRLKSPLTLVALVLLLGALAGAGQARQFSIPPDLIRRGDLNRGFVQGLDALRFFSASGVATVWLHNLRAVLLASLLGVFSFGVLGILVLMLPLMLLGFFTANIAAAGLPPLTFLLALVAPHGLLEIPAIILAGAAIMRLGGTLAAPARGQTIGEAWLVSLADWAKIILGLVVPLLLAAAAVEVLVTPHIALRMLGG